MVDTDEVREEMVRKRFLLQLQLLSHVTEGLSSGEGTVLRKWSSLSLCGWRSPVRFRA